MKAGAPNGALDAAGTAGAADGGDTGAPNSALDVEAGAPNAAPNGALDEDTDAAGAPNTADGGDTGAPNSKPDVDVEAGAPNAAPNSALDELDKGAASVPGATTVLNKDVAGELEENEEIAGKVLPSNNSEAALSTFLPTVKKAETISSTERSIPRFNNGVTVTRSDSDSSVKGSTIVALEIPTSPETAVCVSAGTLFPTSKTVESTLFLSILTAGVVKEVSCAEIGVFGSTFAL